MHMLKTAACHYILFASVSLALSLGKPVRRQVKEPEPELKPAPEPVLRLIDGELIVQGSYMFLFNSDVGTKQMRPKEVDTKNQVYYSVQKILDNQDAIQVEFSFGNMAGFFVFDVSDDKLKQLESEVSAFGRFMAEKAYQLDYSSKSTDPIDEIQYKRPVSGQCRNGHNFDYLDRILDEKYGPPNDDCEKIDVYVLDAGINNHPDFNGRLLGCYNYASLVPGNCEDLGSGTHLAGLIGSDTFGVTSNVNLYSIRAIVNIQKSFKMLLSNLVWAYTVAQNLLSQTDRGILYLTFPYIGQRDSNIEDLTSNFIRANNVVFITTAGLQNSSACNYSLTSVPSVVSVGSVNTQFNENPNSNYGQCIDILALSTSMISLYQTGTTPMQYSDIAGAQVAGVVAQYWVQRPELNANDIRNNINSNSSPLFDNWAGILKPGTPDKLIRYKHRCCSANES